MQTSPIDLTGPDGGVRLARLAAPIDGVPRASAVFLHELGVEEGSDPALTIARALAARGVAALIIDDLAADLASDAGEAAVDEALLAAGAALARELGSAPELLIAHGRLASAAVRAALRRGPTRAIALIDPRVASPAIPPTLAGGNGPLPTLVLGAGDADGSAGDEEWRAGAPQLTSVVAIDGADPAHLAERDAAWIGQLILAWAGRYLPSLASPAASPGQAASAEGARIVARGHSSGFRTEVMAGGHPLVVDEPLSAGGTDEGPTPYDLIAAALGACTAMTLQLYARRKGWPLVEAVVRLRHGKVHAADEEACASRPVRLDAIERVLEVIGPLDDVQRMRLLEIADRCPVHRTLETGVRITTRME